MNYAENTSVPIDRSQAEIKKILAKYGASSFVYGESIGQAMIMFEMSARRIKFLVPLPVKSITKDKRGYLMSQSQVDQGMRSRWRAVVLAIKAKLECVDSGITTLEQEFMAHIVMPNGKTVGEEITPMIKQAYSTGRMVPLLGEGHGQ